jgi:hypothetical protein
MAEWQKAVRGKLIVPVKVEMTLHYDMGAVRDVNAHGMTTDEVGEEAEEMVSEYLSEHLTREMGQRVLPPTSLDVQAGKPRLK